MSTWTQDRLQQIESSDDLHIAPFREDGVTPGTPTWIWSVVVDGELYVRAYKGTSSRWYQAASKQKAGQLTVAGQTTDVSFEQVSGEINDRIDAAYRAKYSSSPYLKPMIGDRARRATVRILPRA
ncbi:MAG: hypothetical protein JWQ49_1326 [Edaphobacter sp.]|nr:hypothetical protein [Edaphobacter sp.]